MAQGKRRKTKRVQQPPRWRKPLLVLIPAVAVLVLAWLWLRPEATPTAEGAPRMVLSQELIDHGDVQFNIPVESVFVVRNEGDGLLQILGEPQVELRDGC